MCCPGFGALRREILIGWPRADVFDCSRSTRHVYMHVQVFTASAKRCVWEIARLEKCIGSCDIHSGEIRKYVYCCQVSHHRPGLCVDGFNSFLITADLFFLNIHIVRVLTGLCDVCRVYIL